MGRHSRKGKAGTRGQERSGIPKPSPHADQPAQARPRPADPQGQQGVTGAWEHGVPPQHAPARPAPGQPGPGGAAPGPYGTPAHGIPAHGVPAHGTPAHGAPGQVDEPARGGHPQLGEPGGRPPGAGYGYAPPQAPAHPHIPGRRSRTAGPRQEYLDAFEQDASATGGTAPAQPADAPGTVPAPGSAGEAGPPGRRRGGAGESEPPGRRAAGGARGQRHGSRARTYTGIAAAAITTVLAVVVAAQVADGKHGSGRSDRGLSTGKRAAAPATGADAERADRGTRPTPGHEPGSYNAKMAHVYPLADDLKGSGKFTTVPGHDDGPAKGKPIRYRVDIEKGLPLDGELFAEAVQKTLNDKRSWAHDGERSFERVSSGEHDFVITLASPHTTDVWCAKSGLDTSQEKVSCDSAATERVMINGYRWARGAETYGDGQMHAYRQMLINHEVGHRLGHGHVGCPGDGKLAPVMMQQTKYLTTDGKTCRPNAWPHPRG
ncbi:DUF3152 domain-containing protein [Streptomyces albus]|nr:DUF3152 domain-containing protein [Streptomyces sp. PHES57]